MFTEPVSFLDIVLEETGFFVTGCLLYDTP